jgi:H+/gluconate symporter-like permease
MKKRIPRSNVREFRMKTGGADWLSWVLQFIVGCFVGAFIGFSLILRRYRPPLISGDMCYVFISGAALMGGAIASHYGDELWLRSTYRVFPPDAPEQSKTSNICSLVIGICGVLMVIFSVCRNYGLI